VREPQRPLAPPERVDLAGEETAIYDRLVERMGSVDENGQPRFGCFWGTLLHWPAYAANRADLSSLVRTAGEREGTYSHSDREFVDQVLAVHLGTNVVQRLHLPDALAAGVRLEAIEALFAGRDSDLTEDERLLATYIRQVVDGTVDDVTWARMVHRLGARGAVEYTIFITVLLSTMRQYQAFGCEDPPQAEIDGLLQDYKEGRRELPDWRRRIR
jgi:hypothetical protein